MPKPSFKQQLRNALLATQSGIGKPPGDAQIAYLLGTSYLLWSVDVLEKRRQMNSTPTYNPTELVKTRCDELWGNIGQSGGNLPFHVLNTLAKYDSALKNEIASARLRRQSDAVTAKELFTKYGATYAAAIPEQLMGSQKEVYDSIPRRHTIKPPTKRELSIDAARKSNYRSMYGTPKNQRILGAPIRLGTTEKLRGIANGRPWLRKKDPRVTAKKFDPANKLSVIPEAPAEQEQDESAVPYTQNSKELQNEPLVSPVQAFKNDLQEETNKLQNRTSSWNESEQCRLLISTYFLCSRADPSLLPHFLDESGNLSYKKTLETFLQLRNSYTAADIQRRINSWHKQGYPDQSIVGGLLLRWQPTLSGIPDSQQLNKKMEQLNRIYAEAQQKKRPNFARQGVSPSSLGNVNYRVYNYEYQANLSNAAQTKTPNTESLHYTQVEPAAKTFDGAWWPLMEKDKKLLDEYIKNPDAEKWRNPPPKNEAFRTPTNAQAFLYPSSNTSYQGLTSFTNPLSNYSSNYYFDGFSNGNRTL